MSPAPGGRGQPATFRPGSHVGAFSVRMPEGTLTWQLGANTATASTTGRQCSVVGDSANVGKKTPFLIDLHPVDNTVPSGAIVPSAPLGGPNQPALDVAGHTSGSFSMGTDGSAHYSIPLWVPEGRAGIEPSLAINYASNGGDGPLGVGFGLTGLSEITRCSRTMADDGVAQGISWLDPLPGAHEKGDKLCLDGNGLVPLDSAGRPLEYRTQHETFSQVLVDGYDVEGPTSFTVRTKDGLILKYGTRPESRLESLQVRLTTTELVQDMLYPVKVPVLRGDSTASYELPVRLSWALTEVSDRSGNTMVLDYELRSAGHEECASVGPRSPDTTMSAVC